ncbi:ATP-binding protein [Paenibacillus sp. CAU 1782]
MLYRVFGTIAIAFFAFSFIPLSMFQDRGQQQSGFVVKEGVLDLKSWDVHKQGRIKLDGEWEFYWNQLLSPQSEQGKAEGNMQTSYMKVPGVWNGQKVDGNTLPAHGTATYRVILKNAPEDFDYALKKSTIRYASTIYANGKKLFEDGRLSINPDEYRMGNTPKIGFIPRSMDGNIEIIVHVSNFNYPNSGIATPIYFGELTTMLSAHQENISFEFGAIVVLTTLSLILLITYAGTAIYKNRDDSLLPLGLLCLLFAIYNGLFSERILYSMFMDGLSYDAMYKLKDICSFLCLIMLVLYLYHLKKNLISSTFAIVIISAIVLCGLLIALLPISTYIIAYPIIILLYSIMILSFLVQAAFRFAKSKTGERLGALLIYAILLCFMMYTIDLTMFSGAYKENMRVGQIYLVLFSILALFIAVLRFFAAYRTVNTMKDQLLRLDKLKDDFLSSTSHELKTPLNAIVNITDSLLMGAEGQLTDNQSRNLAIVVGSGRRLTHLVDELLDYSKMKHGDVALYKTNVNLKESVDSVIRIHLFLLGGKEITLDNSVDAAFPAIHADGNRLIQILHNLIGNAVKFTESGSVKVSASIVGGMAEIRVSDSGSGIDPDMLERIFLPFEQGERNDVRQRGGTGLGLSITRKLVELHGGIIAAEAAPGTGATFIFTLPLSAASYRRGQTQRTQESLPPASDPLAHIGRDYPVLIQGKRSEMILVIDDDPANLQTMMNLLKLGGYSCAVANRGGSGLDLLERMQGNIHLAIVDIMMPDMSGYEVLQRIRERYSPSDLPVLILTAGNKANELKMALEGGANDFVAKPFQSEELLARVGSLTRLRASVREAKESEIAFLRSQINPHFLHNALNAIAELCVDMPEQAERLTVQLSHYLRSSILFRQLDSLTSLENELEMVEAYVGIEQARYGNRLDIHYHIDADPSMSIPPLILQPLVENAIRHGLMGRIRGGKVTLDIQTLDSGDVRFSVEDNGAGIGGQKLKTLLQPDPSRNGVALMNIAGRLRLLYGRNLHIESVEGEGTLVSFEIPARQPKLNGG